MWISCRFSIIGFHLILLTHIAHTFVLLTANMEDVRKLAKKFVSESLAENIADFIARATQNMTAKGRGPEVNDMNANTYQVSKENNMFNVEKHNYESREKESNIQEDITKENQDAESKLQPVSAEQKNQPAFESQEKEYKNERVDFPRPEGKSRYIATEQKSAKQYEVLRTQEKKKHSKKTQRTKGKDDNNDKTTPVTEINKVKSTNKKIKRHPHVLLSQNVFEENIVDGAEPDNNKNFFEDNIVDGGVPDNNNNQNIDDFSENRLYQQRSYEATKKRPFKEFTTRKAVYEFDHYDIMKPQRRVIATSGPVVLRKMFNKNVMSGEKWWEKPLPIDNTNNKKGAFE